MATSTPPAPNVVGQAQVRRRIARAFVKSLCALVALALIARKVDLHDLGLRLGQIAPGDIAMLTALYGLQTAVGVVRWRRLLVHVGERVSFMALAGDVMVGLMFNMFLPTSVGGDVVRALRVRRRTRVPHHAWSTSLFERLAGLVALTAIFALAVVAAMLGVFHGGAHASALPFALRAKAALVAITLILAFFVAAAPFRILATMLEARIPAAALSDVHGIVRDLEGPLATTRVRAETLAWSALSQAIAMLFVVASANSLGAPGHELAILIGIPLIFILSMVPLTLGGHGLREGLYVVVLGALGVPSSVALGLATIFLAASILYASAGAIVLVASRLPESSAPEMDL
jgi:glycosyltransferase 2 family protein